VPDIFSSVLTATHLCVPSSILQQHERQSTCVLEQEFLSIYAVVFAEKKKSLGSGGWVMPEAVRAAALASGSDHNARHST
jgi:hypothetical protein